MIVYKVVEKFDGTTGISPIRGNMEYTMNTVIYRNKGDYGIYCFISEEYAYKWFGDKTHPVWGTHTLLECEAEQLTKYDIDVYSGKIHCSWIKPIKVLHGKNMDRYKPDSSPDIKIGDCFKVKASRRGQGGMVMVTELGLVVISGKYAGESYNVDYEYQGDDYGNLSQFLSINKTLKVMEKS